jgi:chorismate--pyruvate lyase
MDPDALNKPVSQPAATRWQPHKRFLRTAVPADLCDWLLDTASLTLRLQQWCPGRFEVRVLSQQWGLPAPSESQALGMRRGCRAIIRQVQLLCDGRPWIYARTVIPVTSLRGRLRRLANPGTQPLGGVLFADPGMQRGIVELACIRRGEALYHAAMSSTRQRTPAIWGRRSVFTIARKPLLVSEIFLPAFPAASGSKPLWKCR